MIIEIGITTCLLIGLVVTAHGQYESSRCQMVWAILSDWHHHKDSRVYQYGYDEMLYAKNLKRWYGFKMPREEDFPKK